MAIPMYGQNNEGNALGALAKNTGYTEITTTTAADASHTLTEAQGGIVFITAALATGSVIKLPEATIDNIGLEYRIVFGGTMAVEAKIQLPNAGSAVYAGVITGNRCGNGAGVADAAAVNRTTVVTNVSDGEKSFDLDENDVTFGGAIGTDVTFSYVSPDVVFVTGSVLVNVATTAVDLVQSTSFTATGWS